MTNILTRSKFKAVIQTSHVTGVSRVFYRKSINGKLKVVLKEIRPSSSYRVTGYPCLNTVNMNLKGAVPVYRDEQVLYDGKPCEHML